MKKRIALLIIGLLIATSLIFLASASESRICKNECNNIKNLDKKDCHSNYESCKEECTDRKCIRLCYNENKNCSKEVNSEYLKCQKKCKYINKNITCMNGKYKAGETFLQGCEICECNYKKRISCKKTDFCNFKDVLNDKNICETNNGLYQQLCNGPYFDIVCSQSSFCLCDGDNNYNCPDEYVCIHNFNPSLTRRGYTITGWKDLLGFSLGDIGICAKKPVLESCGNGICENVVIEGEDAESPVNCPMDCE